MSASGDLTGEFEARLRIGRSTVAKSLWRELGDAAIAVVLLAVVFWLLSDRVLMFREFPIRMLFE